ncbi:MAG: Photosynthesis system assembly factor [Frankiales bacterium]|nr:Photosynthesis system assembly factor [Frankiales bacterium]
MNEPRPPKALPWRRPAMARFVLATAAATVLAGCGSSVAPRRQVPANAAPAAESFLSMTSSQSGYGVLRAGSSSILAHTDDGWRSAQNVTPPAVPTGGGLSLAVGPGLLAVGVDSYDRLLFSPLLTSTDHGHTWVPRELPGPLSDARNSVAFAGSFVTAVVSTERGTLVETDADGWRELTRAAALSPAPQLVIDSVEWAGPQVGWVTGRNPDGGAVAFTSADGGRTWRSVGSFASSAIAALAPCGAGSVWQLPIIDSDLSLRILSTADQGVTWAAGAPVAVSTPSPVWSCQGQHTLVVGRDDRLAVSTDAGLTWRAGPVVPAGVTGLSAQVSGPALAVSNDPTSGAPKLRSSINGSSFAAVTLPAWIGQLAAEQVAGS